ncbi:unnamed protein product [Caenorhabditis angaria]|uniref:Uncharacterized protein n=1 Tax=Caenorhabditis angaria TaxID=860376 RepID=A0A9P1N2T5_9PELO|nr:unnamed protein product [Caenorhabditis angaria]
MHRLAAFDEKTRAIIYSDVQKMRKSRKYDVDQDFSETSDENSEAEMLKLMDLQRKISKKFQNHQANQNIASQVLKELSEKNQYEDNYQNYREDDENQDSLSLSSQILPKLQLFIKYLFVIFVFPWLFSTITRYFLDNVS